MNLHELFTSQLPLNRKERYYTGTVLPQIIAADNFSGFNRFWKLIGGDQDLEIQISQGQANIQFFTEYNLKESAYNNAHEDAFKQVKGDTPDVLILIITPTRNVLIAIEAKMYEPVDVVSLKIQMKEQKKVLDILCHELAIKVENTYHVAIVPDVFKRAAVFEIKATVSWEEIINTYKDLPNYFLDVLKYATEHYSKYVSTRNKSTKYEAEMRGRDIYDKYKDGTLEFTLVGRGNIQDSKMAIARDVEGNDWEFRKYKISNVEVIRNGNWCKIQDFVKIVDQRVFITSDTKIISP